LQEAAVLTAFFIISPLGIGALFAFARFADRNFRDTAVFEIGQRVTGEETNVR
jgi:hypothetical protein